MFINMNGKDGATKDPEEQLQQMAIDQMDAALRKEERIAQHKERQAKEHLDAKLRKTARKALVSKSTPAPPAFLAATPPWPGWNMPSLQHEEWEPAAWTWPAACLEPLGQPPCAEWPDAFQTMPAQPACQTPDWLLELAEHTRCKPAKSQPWSTQPSTWHNMCAPPSPSPWSTQDWHQPAQQAHGMQATQAHPIAAHFVPAKACPPQCKQSGLQTKEPASSSSEPPFKGPPAKSLLLVQLTPKRSIEHSDLSPPDTPRAEGGCLRIPAPESLSKSLTSPVPKSLAEFLVIQQRVDSMRSTPYLTKRQSTPIIEVKAAAAEASDAIELEDPATWVLPRAATIVDASDL